MDVLKRLLREWPLALAAAGLASLFYVPRFARSESLAAGREAHEIAELRRVVSAGLDDSEDRVRSFLIHHPEGPYVPEAQFLAGLAVSIRARTGVFPGLPALTRAWLSLNAAQHGGFDAAAVEGVYRELAALLLERGHLKEGIERLSELQRRVRDPELSLELARALARRGFLEAEHRQALLDEAASHISEYVREAAPEKRLRGFLTQARISWDLGRYEEMLPLLVRELADHPRPADRGLLQLERGRALARLGKYAEALAALDDAERLLTDPGPHAVALLFQAELFARAGNPETTELCRRIMGGPSPYGPLAHLILGLHELEFRPEEALATLLVGLGEVRRPRIVDEAGFDTDWFHATLKRSWDAETEASRLVRFAALLPDLQRLYPAKVPYVLDEARLWERAGRFDTAADRFLAAAERMEGAMREQAVWEAARACRRGGLQLRAAEIYRRWYDLRPEANARGLFEQGDCLHRAGRFDEALRIMEEYLLKTAGRSPEAGAAALARGSIFEGLGRREEALLEVERILRARDLVSDPGRPEWAAALLKKGELLLDLGRLREARTALEEYLERYGEAPGPGPVRAADLLIRGAQKESLWKEGLQALARFAAAVGRLVPAEQAAFEDRLRETRFLEGDFRFNLGDFEGAVRAYGEAYRRHIASDERIWGLLGRGRSLARLGRLEEARRDYANGRALFEERREALGASLGGRGRDYWPAALDLLAKEVR